MQTNILEYPTHQTTTNQPSHHGIVLEVVSTRACLEKVRAFLVATGYQQPHSIGTLGGIPEMRITRHAMASNLQAIASN